MIDQLYNIDFSKLIDILIYIKDSPLLFNTGLFLILFLIFSGLYWITKRSFKYNSILVILFSFYFYYKSSEYYCFMLLAMCISDYTIGRILGNSQSHILRKSLVALSVISNIAILTYFKYFNLLLSTFYNFSSTHFDPLTIAIPAGISFLSFRSISYIIDIYRKEIKPEKNIINYIFFLSFFPPLLAGPVVRAKDMLPQIRANNFATKEMIGQGFFLIMCGLIKKAIIADYIGVNFVDRIFDNPALYSGFENLIGVIGYSLQIYCDFSGYSDMAIGIALTLGYKFKDNFNAPYKSQNPSEFWRRWHISLSTWLRDYLYIPLGGNRSMSIASYIWLCLFLFAGLSISTYLICDINNSYLKPISGVLLLIYICYLTISTFKFPSRRKNIITSMHLLITMLIGGLWHGASWMFVLWGAWTGILLILHKQLKKMFKLPENKRNKPWQIFFNIFFTFILMSFGWILFRSHDIYSVYSMITQITTDFTKDDPLFFITFLSNYQLIFIAIIFGYIMHFAPKKWTTFLCSKYSNSHLIIKSAILALVLFFVIQAGQSELVPFIYQQF